MTATKKALDEASPCTDRITAVIKFLLPVLGPLVRILFKFGPLRRSAVNTVGARVGAISRFAERGEHERAVAVAIKALKQYRYESEGKFAPTGRDFWWSFMALAAKNLEEYDDSGTWDELIEMARNGVEPFEGYEAAKAYLAFSRWKYRNGDYDAALEFAETAAGADATWAEPDFVLGWYCLALGGGDALTYFTEAIRKDRGILFRIANDPLCRRHPHVVQRLKALSAAEIVTRGTEPA